MIKLVLKLGKGQTLDVMVFADDEYLETVTASLPNFKQAEVLTIELPGTKQPVTKIADQS